MKQHPFTSKDGVYCDWCNLPERNQTHLQPPTEWDSTTQPLVTGWVIAALHEKAGDGIIASALPVFDEDNNYTNIVRVTTNAGATYDVTVTPHP